MSSDRNKGNNPFVCGCENYIKKNIFWHLTIILSDHYCSLGTTPVAYLNTLSVFREIHHFKVKFQTITKPFCIATMQQCYIFYFLSNICMTKNHLTMNRYMLCLWHKVNQPKITTRKGTNIYEKYVSQQLYNKRTTSVPKLVYCSSKLVIMNMYRGTRITT